MIPLMPTTKSAFTVVCGELIRPSKAYESMTEPKAVVPITSKADIRRNGVSKT